MAWSLSSQIGSTGNRWPTIIGYAHDSNRERMAKLGLRHVTANIDGGSGVLLRKRLAHFHNHQDWSVSVKTSRGSLLKIAGRKWSDSGTKQSPRLNCT